MNLSKAPIAAARHFKLTKGRWPTARELKDMLFEVGIQVMCGGGERGLLSYLEEKIELAKAKGGVE